jgi:hypothetical protein
MEKRKFDLDACEEYLEKPMELRFYQEQVMLCPVLAGFTKGERRFA